MATLEIHDRQSQVRRVRISQENPAMFGSDPMCDVVLEGPGIQPFHGRIRWKNGRFKVDVSADVPWIEVNGVPVKSKSLQQGDEVRVGHSRIFLISVQEGPDHGEKTTVQEPPRAAKPAPGRPMQAQAVDYHRLEMAPPSVEAPPTRAVPEPRPGSRESPLPRSQKRRSSRLDAEDLADLAAEVVSDVGATGTGGATPIGAPPSKPAKRGVARGLLRSFDRAPGDDRIAGSPLVIALVAAFAILVGTSYALYSWIIHVNASRQYRVAVEDMEAGLYLNAIKGFDGFLAANPKEARSEKARVLKALARVKQHTGPVGTSWNAGFSEAQAMLDEVGDLPAYRDSSVDLAEEIRKIAEGLADRSAEVADPKTLADAEAAVQLHSRVAGPSADLLVEKSRIPAKLVKARFAIRKSQDRASAIVGLDSALKAGNPGLAYATRDRLIRQYPDLAADRELTSRLTRANELIRQGVTFDPSGRPAENEPRRDLLGPPTSLVLRLDPGKAPSGSGGPVAYAVADGSLYGVDASSGAPRWQVAVGQAVPFPPLAVPGSPPTVLLVDSRSNELIRLEASTGKLLWRQELGGPVDDAPLLLGNQVYQPTLDGRLLQIDLASGAVRGTLKLGRRLARTPVTDDSVSHLYLLADEDCLFILSLDPLTCVAVEYLGQELGAVACPPSRVGRFFVLPENTSINQGRWRIFVIDESGTKLKPVQEIPIGGWTRATPAASGPVIWSSSDRGELIAFAIGLPEAKSPFTPIARAAPGLANEGPSFPWVKTERDFWLASSRSGRFELDLERGRFTPAWTLGEAGPALAPLQAFDRVLVLTQQNLDGPGASLWGVEPATGQVVWRTVLSSPWPVSLTGSSTGDALSTLAADGRNLVIEAGSLRSGGFVEQPLPKPGLFRLPASIFQKIEVDGMTVVVPSRASSKILVRAESSEFRSIELPAPLATTLVKLGKNLLIPGADGRVYLIDPRTGTTTADPYVPPFDRSKPIRWRTPVSLEGEAVALADSEGTLRRIAVEASGRPRLLVTAEFKLDKPLSADLASTGSSILLTTEDGKVRSLAARDLGPQGSWPLEGRRLMGPVVVADHAFVADSAGNVLAFAPDGRRLWSSRLRDAMAAGPPAILDRSAWFLGRDGSIQRLSMTNGSLQSWADLGVLPAGGPLAAGPDLVIPSGSGSLRVLDRDILETPGANSP